jgi:hypothetical protein
MKKVWKEITRKNEKWMAQAGSLPKVGERAMGLKVIDGPPGKLTFALAVPFEAMAALKDLVEGDRRWRLALGTPRLDLAARARMGEYEPLIRHFENGGELTGKERRTLASIARGLLPRIGRPPATKTEQRNRDIARFAVILRLYGGKRVADVTARKFNIDRSYVPKLLKKYRGEGWTPYMFGAALAALGADQRVAWRATLVLAGITEDDLREASGRKRTVRK